MQLDSLFVEDCEADQPVGPDEENPPRSDSNSNAAARADSEPRIDHEGRQNEASVAGPASQQSHQGDGRLANLRQKPRKRRNRKRYRPYAKNVTVSIIIL